MKFVRSILESLINLRSNNLKVWWLYDRHLKSKSRWNPRGFLRLFGNNFWTKNTINSIKTIIESSHEHLDTYKTLFEDTTITTNFLKSYICNTSCIEISTLLFSIINDWGIWRSDQTIVCIKEWMLVNGKSLCYETGKELSEKEITVLKKVFLLKSSNSEDVSASKKYMYWIITNSEEKASPKQ